MIYFEKHDLAWDGAEATEGCGMQFVKTMVEILWYIDGRHHVLANQGCTVPVPFANFNGYNVPEASKHRKRTCENMSADILHSHSTSLFLCLQSLYWKRPKFSNFKPNVEKLADSLAQYCAYLRSQNKKVKQMQFCLRCQFNNSLSHSVLRSFRRRHVFPVLQI